MHQGSCAGHASRRGQESVTQEARSLRCQLLEHGRARVEVTRQRPHSGLSHRSPEDTTGGHPAPVDTTDTLGPSLPGWSHRKQTEDMRTLCPCVPQPRAHTPRRAEDTRRRDPQAVSERPFLGACSRSYNTQLWRATLSTLGGCGPWS